MASFFGKKNKLSNDLFVEASYVQFSIVQLIYKNTDEKKSSNNENKSQK